MSEDKIKDEHYQKSIVELERDMRGTVESIHVFKTIELSQTQLKLRKIGIESRQNLIFTSN